MRRRTRSRTGAAAADPARVAERAVALDDAGADLLDIGGESTRPGAEPVPAREELRRILPVLDRLAGRVRAPISVDTYKAEVATGGPRPWRRDAQRRLRTRCRPRARGGGRRRRRAAGADAQPRRLSRHVPARPLSRRRRGSGRRAVRGRRPGARGRACHASRSWSIPAWVSQKRAEATYSALAELPSLRRLDRPILVGPSRKSFL